MKNTLCFVFVLLFSGHQAIAGASGYLNLRGVVPVKHEIDFGLKTLSSNQSTVVKIVTKTEETRVLLLANKNKRLLDGLSEGTKIIFEAL